jgi:hypothetical protein
MRRGRQSEVIACFAATAAFPPVTMTSTLSRTNSAAMSAKFSLRASAQRYSIVTVRPAIQPSSRSRCTKAAVHGSQAEAVVVPRNPIVGSFVDCCARARERPRSRRAAEQRDELAPVHSITSSAATCSVSGTVRPSLLAAFKLMTSSNFVGCTTGRSLGWAPLRIRPT